MLVVEGGVAIAGGVLLYLTAPSQARDHLALVPVVDGEQASLFAMGHF